MFRRALLASLLITPVATFAQLPLEFSCGPVAAQGVVAFASIVRLPGDVLDPILIRFQNPPGLQFRWEPLVFGQGAGQYGGSFAYLYDTGPASGFVGILDIRATLTINNVSREATFPMLIDDRTEEQKTIAPKIQACTAVPHQVTERAGGQVGILGAEVVTPQVGRTFNPGGFSMEASIDGGPLVPLSNIGNLVYLGNKVLYNVKLPQLPVGGAAVTMITRYQQTPGDNTNVGYSHQRIEVKALLNSSPTAKIPRSSVRHRSNGGNGIRG